MNLHFIIPLALLCLPFLKVNTLKYVYFLPILLPLSWVVLGKCPMTSGKDFNNGGFVFIELKKIFPNISKKVTYDLITFMLLFIVILSANKIMKYHKIY